MGYSFALAGEPKGCRGRAESPPASGITRQLCREQFSVKRPDAPTTAREWNLPFHGALYCFEWLSEGVQGGNEGKTQGGLPLGNPVCLWQTELFKLNLKSSPSSSGYNRRRRLAPRSSRKQQAERTSVRAAPIVCPEESPLLATIGDNFAVSKSPLVGIDAPTPARGQGLQPYGALTLFFRWRKKSVQKKASGTATPGKSPLLPIFERGSSQCRAQHIRTANIYVRARSCSLFSSFKKGKAFSLRCLSPLCSPAVGGWQAPPLQVGMLRCGRKVLRRG